jgi:hypothetical protein
VSDATMASPEVAALMDRLGQADPSMQLVMQLLAGAQAKDDPERDAAREAEREARRERARARLGRLRDEHALLSARNDLVAAALGACPCFGEDADCRFCRGRGAPGSLPPDPAAFADLVEPAVRRLGLATPPSQTRPEEARP